jgi:uncharacterized lipoprotein NlpE involved in copper resistance
MTKWYNMAVTVFSVIFILIQCNNQTTENKYIKEEIQKEKERRFLLLKELEALRLDREKIDASLSDLKKYIDVKEKKLSISIQEIKNKKDVPTRNVSDSSYVSLLKELQPK